jgi:hypothetical protein
MDLYTDSYNKEPSEVKKIHRLPNKKNLLIDTYKSVYPNENENDAEGINFIIEQKIHILLQKYDIMVKNRDNSDPYQEYLNKQNKLINVLKEEIMQLKREKMDLIKVYNNKLEMIDIEHKNKLYAQHNLYSKKLNQICTQNVN